MILATEAEHAAREVLTSGPLLEWAWLIVAVPYVASLLIVLVGKRLPGKGAELAVGALGFVMLYGAVLLYLNITQGVIFESSVTVAEVGAFSLEWGWLVDGLSIMMFFLVGVVGFLVFVFAVGYMRGEVRYTFFWAAFTLFAGSMLLLVSAPNLIQLIVGWEGVGVASYLLIGHYWEDKANSSAGMKAFYTNRVADIGLTIGTIILGTALGTFRIEEINAAAAGGRRRHNRCRLRRRHPPLLRGDGEERPVPAPRVAPRRHGGAHAGLGADARRHHGHRRRLPGGADVPAVRVARRPAPQLGPHHRLGDRAARGCWRWCRTTSSGSSPTRRSASWAT